MQTNTAPAVLMVHAYGHDANESLSLLSTVVVQKILRMHRSYQTILLLGGWIHNSLPPRPITGEIMKNWLILHGIPANKLLTQFDLGLHCVMPPRDTIEEIDLGARMLFAHEHKNPRTISFDAVGVWFHCRRIQMIWRSRNARCRKVFRAFSWSTFKETGRMLQEPPGFFLTWYDPEGSGRFFEKLRESRTHLGKDDFPEKNTPLAWNYE